jgi:hypothetical protein
MTHSPALWTTLGALALSLAGCAMNGPPTNAAHLSPAQCVDLTALRNHAPLTSQRNKSELAALRAAGYDPSRWFDPYYPDDLEAAQRQVERWYQHDCQPVRTE